MSELTRFTPSSLTKLATPPVFLLRPAGRRERLRFQGDIVKEGWVRHSDQVLRAETLRGLEALWSPEAQEANVGRVTAYWKALDTFAAAGATKRKRKFNFDPAEAKAVVDLINSVAEHWPPLRKLIADNVMFTQAVPEIAVANTVVGWEGLETRFERKANEVSLDLVDAVASELVKLERDLDGTEGVGAPGTAFMELGAQALSLLSEDAPKAA